MTMKAVTQYYGMEGLDQHGIVAMMCGGGGVDSSHHEKIRAQRKGTTVTSLALPHAVRPASSLLLR